MVMVMQYREACIAFILKSPHLPANLATVLDLTCLASLVCLAVWLSGLDFDVFTSPWNVGTVEELNPVNVHVQGQN